MSQAQQEQTARPADGAEPGRRSAATAARGTVDRVVAWFADEARDLERRRPDLASSLRRVWARPAAVLVPLGVLVPGLLGSVIEGGDAGWFRRASAGMLGDGFLDVFADGGLQIGPLYLIALGVLQAVVEALRLPVLFTLAGVQCGLLTWWALGTTRRVVRATGTTGRRAEAAPWAVGAVLALGGFLAEAVGNGHPEEILLGLLLVEAALLSAAGRRVVPGVLLGVAVGVKLWGVLGAPILLLGRRPTTVVARCLVAGAVAVACYAPFLVWGEVNTFGFQWGVSAGSTLAVLGFESLAGWEARLVQGAAAGLAGAAAALSRRSSPLLVVMVVVAVRLLLDPLRLTYYSGPLVVVALLWIWTSSRVRARVALLVTVLAPVTVLSPYLLPAPLFGWLSTAVLVGLPVAALLVEHPGRRSSGRQLQAVTS